MNTIDYPIKTYSTCPHDCPGACALEVELRAPNTIGRITGAKGNSYTDGVICAKVARYAERIHHPERLGRPLRRRGGKGKGLPAFEPIGWDQALDEVAEKFAAAMQRHGSETLWPYHYAGTMGLLQRDSIDLFRNLLRTSRQHSTFCSTLADAGWIAGVGAKRGADPRSMAHSDQIVIWGGNPVHTQINVMHHVAKARRERGAQLVVVDPYCTATAEKADQHLMLRPGTDGALACAIMHQLFADGLVDRAYLAEYSDASEELEARLRTKTPEWASAITGLDPQEIIDFARLYGKTERSFLRLGYGFTRSRNGAANMHAVSCLPVLTGAWRHPGGGALYSNGGIYGIDQTIIKGLDVLDPATRVFDQSRIGDVLCGNPRDLRGGPPVTALLTQNTNPVAVAPETKKVLRGFGRDDLFICVHEQFMTETAAMADIVLPATMFLEHDDFYQAGGHTHLQVTRPLITPFAESRSNHWVLSQLARRLGFEHPGFDREAREVIDESLRKSGFPDEETLYREHWFDCAPEFETANFLSGFGTPNKRFHFKPDWSRLGTDFAGMPALPDHMPVGNPADAEHPFRLVTAPARHFLNTSFTETPSSQKAENRPTLLLRAEDAARHGIEDGALARVGNRLADILLHARIFDGMQSGVVIIEGIWPNHAFIEGLGVNALVSAEPAPPNGGATYHDTAVWIKPA
uniref:Anaerobic selenocysteine-containing dehydrogenase n=1 Tax=Candidatus Kentrum sp. SD TaxID=2126332 RepID=A0A450Y505_9GAMM|nr:MAG: Anaerobic selenocysteine-containing dehydrogenase [Candidatus Kentron sp. SD]VFK39576.1 MAG: Anaerobic selenocysteine-containing dehydrogenase [Candidatus Kentron sp. SD]